MSKMQKLECTMCGSLVPSELQYSHQCHRVNNERNYNAQNYDNERGANHRVEDSNYKNQTPCGGCNIRIENMDEAFEIESLNQTFHSDCFRCTDCHHVFTDKLPFVPHLGKAYCDRCYEQTFVKTCRVI
jgi:hypothetical protein